MSPINSFLHGHSDIAFWIKFMFTLMIDVWAVTAIFHWVVLSLKWQFAIDMIFFFFWRFICTHLISYRNAEGQFWPESSFMSLSNAGLSEQQYQVSAYTGVLTIILFYWMGLSKAIYYPRKEVTCYCDCSLHLLVNSNRAELQNFIYYW
jgi:hypothetical protein